MLQALAKEIVSSRRTVNKLYENKAQMNSISMHLGESIGKYEKLFQWHGFESFQSLSHTMFAMRATLCILY